MLLFAGTAGGAAAAFAGLPAPWLAGSMIAVILASYAKLPLALPEVLKTAAFILLGAQTGTAVTWDTINRAVQWPLSIAGLGITVGAVTIACYVFYSRVFSWSRPTALFASLPGALSMVILLAEQSAADMKKVIVGQCVRLFFIIAALPFAIEVLNGQAPTSISSTPSIGSFGAIALLVAACVAAGLLFERLSVPAGLILGAVLAAAALSLSGMTTGAAPDMILIPANIVLGGMIGIRFAAIGAGELKSYFAAGLGGFVVGMAVAAAGAALTAWIGGLPLALTLLAFAPGGLEAMIIMSFALGLDPAYVAAHQIVRYVGLVLLMPFVTAMFLGGVHANVSASSHDSTLDDS
jgi:hypothetical protein